MTALEQQAVADQVRDMRERATAKEQMCPKFYGFGHASNCDCLERAKDLRANADRLAQRAQEAGNASF